MNLAMSAQNEDNFIHLSHPCIHLHRHVLLSQKEDPKKKKGDLGSALKGLARLLGYSALVKYTANNPLFFRLFGIL